MVTRLEDLPNELLLDLLEFLDFRSFYHLNNRLDSLIHKQKNLTVIHKNEQPICPEFSSGSSTSDVEEENRRFSPWNQIDDDFCSLARNVSHLIIESSISVDLRKFASLRFLTIHSLKKSYLETIKNGELKHLEFLSFSSFDESKVPKSFVEIFFPTENLSLRQIEIGSIPRNLFNELYSASFLRKSSSNLVVLKVKLNSPDIISFILLAIESLRQLDVVFTIDTLSAIHPDPESFDHQLKRFSLRDPYHRLNFNRVLTALKLMPNVEKLYLNFSTKLSFFKLAKSILRRLDSLKYFSGEIDDVSNERNFSLEQVQRLHPAFSRLQITIDDLQFRTFVS